MDNYTYGKVFVSLFQNSTLKSEGGWLPTYIFTGMISLAEAHLTILFNRDTHLEMYSRE